MDQWLISVMTIRNKILSPHSGDCKDYCIQGVTPCSLAEYYQLYGGSCYHNLHPEDGDSRFLLNTCNCLPITSYHIPKYGNLQDNESSGYMKGREFF
jgi:hypothetical protein